MTNIASIEELFRDEKNFIANAANLCSYLFYSMKDINWVGFYLLSSSTLILGPFQGKIACIRINMGKGVCGTAAQQGETIIVPDVEKFPGHIYCDPNSRSEIVIPIIKNGTLYGVLDIDSPILSRFDENDATVLSNFINELVKASDMPAIKKYYAGH